MPEHELGHRLARVVGEVLAEDLVAAEQQDQLVPGAPAVGQVGVEQPVEVDVQQPARVLGPLDVAARPVERLCDAAQHQARSTQVSLLPPPCEELTTSEPSRSAARVSPPGTTLVMRLGEHERPQVDVRGAQLLEVDRHAAQRDRRLRDELARVGLDLARGTRSRSSAVETGPISIP